ncbi:MAG: TIGR02206 family membrane protein [Firmicutes bacterium]|nr:TIGR02206 family membrane protein [Bacillota bacterium]
MDFFAYTSLEDAIPHGLTMLERLLPIVILFIILFLIRKFAIKINDYQKEHIVRYVLAIMMLIGEAGFLIWNYIHSLHDEVRFIDTLPLQLCSYAIWALAFILIFKSKKVYNYIFVFGIVSVLALTFPNLNHGFNSFRYYQLYYSHSLLVIALYYMYRVHGFYPKKTDLIKSFILLQIIIVYSIILNIIFGTAFLFIGPGNKPIDFAWDWPWHMIEYEAGMALVYYIFYLIFKQKEKLEMNIIQ